MPVIIDGTAGITYPSGTVQNTAYQNRFKNRIINGDMRIDQRNAGASVTPTNAQYLTDRFSALLTQASKFTAQQNAGSVTPPVGFINYLGMTSSSAYSVGSGDAFGVLQKIEGLNIADLGWGTANAKTVTLSFLVRSSLTGTFGGSFLNSAVTRSYPFTYTISSSNTWTQISVTVPGDTTGTWLTTNGLGIQVHFGMGVGTTYSGTVNTWAGAYYLAPTGATSVVGTSGATFYITGVQLEVGSSASAFEYVDYGTQLAMCQRYFEVISTQQYTVLAAYNGGNFLGCGNGSYAVTKRTTPTMTGTGSGGWAITGINLYSAAGATTFGLYNGTPQTYSLIQTRVAGNATPSNGSYYIFEGSTTFNFSAEL